MSLKNLSSIIDIIDASIKHDGNDTLNSWNIIKDWYDKKVDDYRSIIKTSKDWLSQYQAKLISNSWISRLKIKYTNIAGYFIEIPKSQSQKVPDAFVQKQTLVNAIRYITSELKEFESSLLESESFLSAREYELFQSVRTDVLSSFSCIKSSARDISFIDFIGSLASVAYKNNYVRPQLNTKNNLSIEWWRHPVIEQIEKDFISNNLSLSPSNYIHIITGPNMWWKSTFLRQNALIILMSHIWSFVPASIASIPITDKIFSRVWASDNLYLWQSTFMVEMQEIANILHNSTSSSFVIIDEIGRGTSTYDWLSLAWSILKYNHDHIKAKTLFATHYHELVDESKLLKWVSNHSVAVWENEDNLIFLRKIIPWGMKKSYGIEVAQIAWLHPDIISESKKMLQKLEWNFEQISLIPDNFTFLWEKDKSAKKAENVIVNKVKNIDINTLTPLAALSFLNELKEDI